MPQCPYWRRHGSTVGSRCFWAKGGSCCMCAYADVCECHGGESSRVFDARCLGSERAYGGGWLRTGGGLSSGSTHWCRFWLLDEKGR
jgi:hypothetical protein